MLTIQFVRYSEIEPLASDQRIEALLDYVKQDKIVLLEGRLKKQEEVQLIERTMQSINKKFKGIELAVVSPNSEDGAILKKLRSNLISMLLGDREGMTIIGPATVVKEIKQDPNKFQVLVNNEKGK
ncbi:MAG: OapB/ArvB family protein [Nanoarchaeota archaeon]